MNQKKRIFIVEDDINCQTILKGVIRSIDSNVTIDSDESAESALRTVERECEAGRGYDLIIADIFLSGKATGLDLWKACLEKFRDTPLIVTSSLGMHRYFDMIGRDSHAPIFLPKPYKPTDCRFILQDLLNSV